MLDKPEGNHFQKGFSEKIRKRQELKKTYFENYIYLVILSVY